MTYPAAAAAMKINSRFLRHFRLDPVYSLLSAREVVAVLELFKALDIRQEMALDGIYIHAYMRIKRPCRHTKRF